MTTTYSILTPGTKVRLKPQPEQKGWDLVTGTVETAFVAANGIHYEIRLDRPAIHHLSGVNLTTTTAHADNIAEIVSDPPILDQNTRPDWRPLERLAGDNKRIKLGDFMHMGTDRAANGQVLQLYKHRMTRRYLNLDDDGCAYAYVGAGHYDLTDLTTAIQHVLS